MAHLFGSPNSRFFATLQEGRITLHRGSSPLWTRPVAAARELLRVGNQGDVFFRTDEGLARLALSRDADLEPLPALSEFIAGEEGGTLGEVRVNADGLEFLVERITSGSKLSRKLLRILRRGERPEAEAQVEGHELFLFNRATGSLRKFHKIEVDPERRSRFVWAASPDLTFLLVGQAGKKSGVAFKLINTREESVCSEFVMKYSEIPGVWVNESGTVLLEVRVSPQETCLVLTTLNGEKVVLNPPQGFRVLNLGHKNVVLQLGLEPRLQIQSFADETLCQADLTSLGRLGLEFEVLFNERGGLDVVTLKGRDLRVNHSDIETLAVDARRWGMLARQQESAGQEHSEREAVQRRQDEDRSRRLEERSRELAQALAPSPRSGPPAPVDLPSPPEGLLASSFPDPAARRRLQIEADLEKVRMRYISGSLDRSEYHQKIRDLSRELEELGPGEPSPPHAEDPLWPLVEERLSSPLGLAPTRPAQSLPAPPQSLPAPPPTIPAPPQSIPAPPAPPSWSGRARATQPTWSSDALPVARRLDPREFDRQKVERLLEALEQRLAMGEISEATYLELKDRYLKRLDQA